MVTKSEPKKNQPNHQLNNNLPNVWVDSMNLSVRSDDICFLRFATSLPEGFFEQCRILTNKDKLKGMVDAICEAIDYYPSKKQPPKKAKKEPLSH